MFKLHALILFTLTTGLALSGQETQEKDPQTRIEIDVTGKLPKSKDNWVEISSKNFVAAGNADPDELKLALSELEQFRSDFAALFPRASAPSSIPTRIIVFRDRDFLRLFRPQSDAISSDSYFQPAHDVNYVVLHAGDKLSSDILRQYAISLMHDSLGPVPLWLETGLGEYFGAYKLTRLGKERVVKVGLDEYKGTSQKDLLPLNLLMTADADSFQKLDRELQKTFTTESCVLFQYLLQTRRLGAALRMTNEMAEGRTLQRALQDVFKLPEATIYSNLQNHVKMSKDSGWSVALEGLTLDSDKLFVRIIWGQGPRLSVPLRYDTLRADIEGLPVKALSPAEAMAIEGDLQVHNGRPVEAESLLRQALLENESLARGYTTLGIAKTQQKNYSEAQAAFEKARALDPSGYFLGRYYQAVAIREQARDLGVPLSGQQLDEMEAALQEATHGAPEFVPAAEMLAETQLLNHRDPNGSVRLLIDSMKRSPGRASLLILLGRISAAAGDRASAGWMLQRVISGGTTTNDQKEEARSLLAELNLTAAEKTAFADFEINEDASANRSTSTKLMSRADVKKIVSAESRDTRIVRGHLTEIACSKGLTIYVRIGAPGPTSDSHAIDERIENLYSDSNNVEWVKDTGEPADAQKCEKIPSRQLQPPVAITYRPKRKGLTMGEPLVVEFCTGDSFDCDFRVPRPR